MTDDNFVHTTTDTYDQTLDYAVQLTLALLRERGPGVAPGDVPSILRVIYAGVRDAAGEPPKAQPDVVKPTRRQIADSVEADHLISFEDGKRYKMLKRHLGKLGLTVDDYRAKWGLPADYPAVAPSYSQKRSALAKAAGLGRK